MGRMGLWHITERGPHKLQPVGIDLEKNLEEWIERDPGMLQAGLTIVGRQVYVEGGRMDLLALDALGRWVVIEIKSGPIYRETIAQALDYAACLATLPYPELADRVNSYLASRGRTSPTALDTLLEERQSRERTSSETRDVLIYVVGTGVAPGLERVVEYLSGRYGLPINVVAYQVFETDGGQRILARELTDLETSRPARPERAQAGVDDIIALAEQAGIGREFRMVLDAGRRHNLYLRPYKVSVMVTPPSNRTRMLYVVQSQPRANGTLRLYVGPGAFAEFYPVSEETATAILGPDGWRAMTTADVEAFVAALDHLFASVEQPAQIGE